LKMVAAAVWASSSMSIVLTALNGEGTNGEHSGFRENRRAAARG